jgi:hypothetical protein
MKLNKRLSNDQGIQNSLGQGKAGNCVQSLNGPCRGCIRSEGGFQLKRRRLAMRLCRESCPEANRCGLALAGATDSPSPAPALVDGVMGRRAAAAPRKKEAAFRRPSSLGRKRPRRACAANRAAPQKPSCATQELQELLYRRSRKRVDGGLIRGQRCNKVALPPRPPLLFLYAFAGPKSASSEC